MFGHFGDRIGRKKMLILSMTLMGVGSTLIGLLPTYDQIGVWAPILLVLLRVVQGIAVGGEWGGAVLMSAEHASLPARAVGQLHQRRRTHRRGALDAGAGRDRRRDRRGAVPRVGLADPVPAQHRAAGRRPVRARQGRRDAGVRPGGHGEARPPAAVRGPAPPPAQPRPVDRDRLRRVRRPGHHHHVRHLRTRCRPVSPVAPCSTCSRCPRWWPRSGSSGGPRCRTGSGGAPSCSPAPRPWRSGRSRSSR